MGHFGGKFWALATGLYSVLSFASTTPPPLSFAPCLGHSHNDYQHPQPLFDALENHYRSIEADVWLWKGKLRVSHLTPFFWKGDLETLYLDPLQKIVNERGSVYGDGQPFYLWLDIKQGRQNVVDRLFETLSRYPMLSRHAGTEVIPGPVTVIFTGNDWSGWQFFQGPGGFRPAIRAAGFFPAEDPTEPDMKWYALKWTQYFRWNGQGRISEIELAWLREIVTKIHAEGRRLRFYRSPETPEFLKLAFEEKLDLINTDNIWDFGKKHCMTQLATTFFPASP